MIKIQFEQLVDDYYYDRLDAESKEAFETRMIVDTVFAEQVTHYIRGLELMRDHRNMQLKARFEGRESKIRRKAVLVKVARFAALILLTLAIPFTFMQYVFGKKNLANNKVKAKQEIVETNLSGTEELVQWIVQVVSIEGKTEENVSLTTETFDLLLNNYDLDISSDFSGVEDIYDYVMNGVTYPFPDISPELASRFMDILDNDSEFVLNLLNYISKETENTDNVENN